MPHVAIISGSVRVGRNSHRVALYFQKFIMDSGLATCEILDLKAYDFPLFEERLKFQEEPEPLVLEFSEKIKNADGVIFVLPEYNGSFPAAVKNVIDLLNEEWVGKPVAFATVSAGDFAGTQSITSLQFILWKLKALTVTTSFAVPRVQAAFTEIGVPCDAEATDKRAKAFLDALLHAIQSGLA